MQKGFTLIELMIVVAIVGILAAIAIPAYQDYIKRSKTTEVAATLSACKVSVTEFYQTNNEFPATTAQAGCELTAGTTSSQYVADLQVTANTGEMLATVQNIDGTLDATDLGMRPCTEDTGATPTGICTAPVAASDDPIRAWRCFHATTAVHKYLPATCRNTT